MAKQTYSGVRGGSPPLGVSLQEGHLHRVWRPSPVLRIQPERPPGFLLAADGNAADLRVVDVITARRTQDLPLLHIHDWGSAHSGVIVGLSSVCLY